VVQEPLDQLFACMLQIHRRVSDDDDIDPNEPQNDASTSNPNVMFCKTFNPLIKRLIEANLETYELDKSSEFAIEEGDGRRGVINLMRADVLVGVLQVAVDGVASVLDFKLENCTTVLALWKQIQRLEDTVKTKLKKKRRAGAMCAFDLEALVVLLEQLCTNRTPRHQTGLMVLRNNDAFVKHMFRLALELVESLSASASPSSLSSSTASTPTVSSKTASTIASIQMHKQRPAKLKELLSRLTQIAICEYATKSTTRVQRVVVGDANSEKSSAKGRSIKILCLEILHAVTGVVSERFPSAKSVLQLWTDCLVSLASSPNYHRPTDHHDDVADAADVAMDEDKDDVNNNINNHNNNNDNNDSNGISNRDAFGMPPLMWLQHQLSESITAETHRHSSTLIAMISKLIALVSADERVVFNAWIDELCVRTTITDVAVTKGLLGLLLEAHRDDGEHLDVAIKIAKNCLVHRGTVAEKQNLEDHDANMDGVQLYAVITADHCKSMVPTLLIHTLATSIEELEWYSSLHQASTPSTAALVVVSTRLHRVLAFASGLAHLDPEQNFPLAFDTLRYVKRLYDLFLGVVKNQMLVFKTKTNNGIVLEPAVRTLLEATTQYTQDVYSLVSLVNEGPEDEEDDKMRKKKKKPASKANTVESRIIPNLVFAIEQYERHLIQLNDKPVNGIGVTSSVTAAYFLRRHLMVWKIFAPRVIFDVGALGATCVGVLLGLCFFSRARKNIGR